MFNEIEELMKAIDSFKANLVNTEELLSLLKKTSRNIEQAETRIRDNQEQLLASFTKVSKAEEITSQLQNTSHQLAQMETALQANHQNILDTLSRVSRSEDILPLLEDNTRRLQETETVLQANHQQLLASFTKVSKAEEITSQLQNTSHQLAQMETALQANHQNILDTLKAFFQSAEILAMFKNAGRIEELAETMEKMKTDRANSEELLTMLKETSQKMERSERRYQIERENWHKAFAATSKKINIAILGTIVLIVIIIFKELT